jgi:hypothetical protein
MSDERIDRLLDELLAGGSVAADATPGERAELDRLAGVAASLRLTAATVDAEARDSMPTARARFERFIASSRTTAAAPKPRRGLLAGLFGAHHFLMPIATAAAIGVLAVGVLVVSQAVFSGTPSANAQVLTPGDYVQVQGIVAEATGEGDVRQLQLQSEFDDRLRIDLSADTALADGSGKTVATLKKGDVVLVGGVVGKDRRISARTVAPASGPGQPPPHGDFRELRDPRPDLKGKVVTFTVAPDGSRGVVLLEGTDGQRYFVRVDGKSASTLLDGNATAVGTNVRIGPGNNPKEAPFSLSMGGGPPTGGQQPPRPAFIDLRGIIVGREGNVLQVETPHGTVSVIVRTDTHILLGESGLTADAFRRGDATIVGHGIVVTGGLDKATGRLKADVVGIGPRVSR